MDEFCSTSSKTFRATRLLIEVDRYHRIRIEQKVKRFGIHRSQHMMMMYLARSMKSVSQKDIAEALNISQSAVAVTLKKLEKEGLIVRNEYEKDNRNNEVSITEKGAELLREMHKVFSGVDSEMLSVLNDNEIDKLIEYLEKIKENLENKKDE